MNTDITAQLSSEPRPWQDSMHFTPEADRGIEWARSYMQGAIQQCLNSQDYATLISRMLEEKAYREGRQADGRYRKIFARRAWENKGGGSNITDKSYLNLNHAILPMVPKVVDILVELGRKRGYFVNVEANDPESNAEKARTKFEMMASMILQEMGLPQMINETLGTQAVAVPPKTPKDMDELEERMESFRLAIESAAETAIMAILKDSNFRDRYPDMIDDMVTTTFAILDQRSDGEGRVIVRKIDPLTAIFDMNSADFCARHFGEMLEFDDAGLVAFASKNGLEMGDEQWQEVLRRSRGYRLAPYRNGWQDSIHRLDSWRVMQYLSANPGKCRVVRMTWRGVVKDGYDVREAKGYEKYTRLKRHTDPVSSGKKHTKKAVQYEVIYEGYFIMGANIAFGFAPLRDMARTKRDYKTLCKTDMPIRIIRSSGEESIVRRMIPVADQIQIAWLKIQQILQKVKPPGLGINEERVIAAISNKEDAKTAFFDALDIYESNGVFKFGGSGSGDSLPFIPIANTAIIELTGVRMEMMEHFSMMKQIAGLNEFTDASTPDSKSLVRIGEMAQAGTNNAIGRVYERSRELVGLVCQGAIARLLVIAETHGLERYEGPISEQQRLVLESAAEDGLVALGVNVDCNPDETFMQSFMEELRTQRATYANSGGKDGIGADDYMTVMRMLRNGESYRQAELFLRSSMRRTKKEALESEMASIQANTEAQSQVAQQTQMLERETLELQYAKEAELDTIKTQNKAMLLELQLQGDSQNLSLKTSADMQMQQRQLVSDDKDRQADLLKASQDRQAKTRDILLQLQVQREKIKADIEAKKQAASAKKVANKS